MSEPTKAVFLSYASQDKDVAQRICDALRAAGVEVWFDKSELRGGDAWDALIRKRIKECALFVPVITPTTNARAEGYFRLEWKLAVDRSHLMADDAPFLFPIVVGDVSDATARVPDKFRDVQWTRLRLDETPAELGARVATLLRGTFTDDQQPTTDNRAGRPRHARWQWWMVFPVIGTIMGLMFAVVPLWKSLNRPARREPPKSEAPAAPAVSGARQPAERAQTARELSNEAFALLQGLEVTREDLALAEDLGQRALKLDSTDGEIWAVSTQIHSAYVYRGWDTSPARREQIRVAGERAIRLAPKSVEARLAQASAWSTFNVNKAETEKLLREVVAEQPDNQAALRFLAVTVLGRGELEECLALNERSAALPGGDPLALYNNARYLQLRGRQDEAYATMQRAIAQKPFTSAYVFKVLMEIYTRGDLAAAEATLKRIPPATLLEDRANYLAGLLPYYQRNAEAALKAWGAFPRDAYEDFQFDGPKGELIGFAYELDGREAAAKIEWRTALQVADKRLAATPNNPRRHYDRAYLLACLGDKDAPEALRTYEQLAGVKLGSGVPLTFDLALVYARLGRFDDLLAHWPAAAIVRIRLDPRFDALRKDPRFDPLLKKPEGAK